ncbi:MAG: V-type ATP synthase subunit K [Treponema sp.]|nr:V-type ATP synthase subunit K [Treponema sp.]
MDPRILGLMGAGFVMGISAFGAALAMGIAGVAAVGAWKRCYKANKPAPMTLIAFVGFPLTEVFYGYILMRQMMGIEITAANAGLVLSLGIGAGVAIAFVAIAEGWVGAAAADSLTDTGKGFANYVAVLGVCETVALFVMVLSLISL